LGAPNLRGRTFVVRIDMSQKPSLPRGTRDFGPAEVARRQYVGNIIRETFKRYGFAPLETPSFENLSTLTGKYGEEGDQLLYRILNSGDFMSDVTLNDVEAGYKKVSPKLAEKGLRYDLTVPFARYVVMNRHNLTLPFRRYQMQPVWRADRPSKGRYREFVQCDADVVGTDSLLCEAEIVMMIHEVMTELQLPYILKINHRGLLRALYDIVADPAPEADLYTALDKLDKIGWEGVGKELTNRGFGAEATGKLQALLKTPAHSFYEGWLADIEQIFKTSTATPKALTDLRAVLDYLTDSGFDGLANVELDLTLARGLSYYTGCIFEVKIPKASVGSVSGGGRYDNLTGGFGMPGLSGVGFSFGIDRLCDVMEEFNCYPAGLETTTQVLVVHFEEAASRAAALDTLAKLRANKVSAELYPEPAKLKKQFAYADAKRIPLVVIPGPEEVAGGHVKVKTMATGAEQTLALKDDLLPFLLTASQA
jgi:histidyl-tRNA synthetase